MKVFLAFLFLFCLCSFGQSKDISAVVHANRFDIYVGGGYGINTSRGNQFDIQILLGTRNTYFANALHPALLFNYSISVFQNKQISLFSGLQLYASHLPIASQRAIKSDLGLHVGFEVGDRWKWAIQMGSALGTEFYSLGRQNYFNIYGTTKLSYEI